MPKLLYGSPAYANGDGKVVLFYQERARFKGRYANLTFFGAAQLDDGTMWPTSFAITEFSSADEKVIAKKASCQHPRTPARRALAVRGTVPSESGRSAQGTSVQRPACGMLKVSIPNGLI
jgi:hypothetical protein